MEIILLGLFILFRIFVDYELIVVKKISPPHWLNAGIMGLVIGCLMVIDKGHPYWFTALTFTLTYSYFFDLGLNLSRGLPYYYIGDTAATDKIEQWVIGSDINKYGMIFALKTIVVVGLIGAYFLNY